MHARLILLLSLMAFSAAAQAIDKVRVQLRWDHQFQFAGFYAALWEGFYRDAGIEVELRSAVQPDGTVLSATEEVQERRAEVGVGAADILLAVDRGAPLRIVAPVFQHSGSGFFSDQAANIQTPGHLPGKRVARLRDDLIDIELQVLLKAEGIDLAQIDSQPHVPGIDHLLQGRVDVMPGNVWTVPYLLQRHGVRYRVLRPLDYGVDFYGDTLFAHADWVAQKPERVARFVDATLRGWRYALENPERMAEQITRKLPRHSREVAADEVPAFNRFQAEAVRELTVYPAIPLGHLNVDRLQRIIDHLHRSGLLKHPLHAKAVAFDPDRDRLADEQQHHRQIERALGVVAVLVVVAAGFAWLLRNRVVAATRLLAERERRVAASEARLAGVINASLDAIITLDHEHRIVIFNPAAEQLFGCAARDALGGTLDRFIPDRFHQACRRGIDEFAAEPIGQRPAGQTRVVSALRGDGREFLAEASISKIVVDGRCLFNVALRDLTARRQAEEEFKALHQRFQDLVDTTDGVVWESDAATFRFTFVSRKAESLLGYSVHEWCQPGFWAERLHPEDRDWATRHCAESTRRAEPHSFEYRMLAKDGRTLWIQDIVTPVIEGGEVRWLRGIMIDVTGRKQVEAELERHRESLELRVEERTRELSEAKAAAEGASIAKGTFLANMSHEIRTPMNAILGMSSLMRREGVTPQQAQRLDKIEAASHHLLAIINDILDLSKIEANKLRIDSVPLSIERIVSNVQGLTEPFAASKNLRLTCVVPRLSCVLLGDPVRVQQALLNLLSNAVKFTETGAVTLKADILEEHADRVSMRFSVSDTGIGIPAEKMDRLFGSFEQVDGSITRTYGGTGLGLSITKLLVEMMGGSVGVESTLGAGSTFWLTLGFRKAADVAQVAADVPSENAELVLMRDFKGRRILLAEDEPVNQEITRLLLMECGLEVDLADDGAAALRMALEGDYSMILLDMQMPELSGPEVARRLREAGTRQVPIIALTANAFVEDRETCLNAGMNDFLTKPFVPDLLYAVVLRWFTLGARSSVESSASGFVLGPAFRLGVPQIDLEHQEIFARLERLRGLHHDESTLPELHRGLSELGHLLVQHFSSEEAIFGRTSMPAAAIEQHRSAHRRIIQNFADTQILLISEGNPDYSTILARIEDWISGHFLSFDCRMKPYLADAVAARTAGAA